MGTGFQEAGRHVAKADLSFDLPVTRVQHWESGSGLPER